MALVGGCAAITVAVLAADNPGAAPTHLAWALRLLIVAVLVAAGLYVRATGIQPRMGALLIAVGLYSALWLLNGSTDRLAFGIGMLLSGLAPTLFSFLMLAHPTGLLSSSGERGLLGGAGAVLAVSWTGLVLTSTNAAFATPLLRCATSCRTGGAGCTSGCPGNILYLGSSGGAVRTALIVCLLGAWAALGWGTLLMVVRKARSAAGAVRSALVPVQLAAWMAALTWTGFLAARALDSRLDTAVGAAYVGVAVVLPVAIVAGLLLQRHSMSRALARLISDVAAAPGTDPEPLVASALGDPSLRIAYVSTDQGIMVDWDGRSLAFGQLDRDHAVTWIERDHKPVAAVIYHARLADQEPFVRAAGAAALMRVESAQLRSELRASTRELSASRLRLIEAADAERQRIERDLHDGVQQQIVALRLKLDMAAETAREEPERSARMLATIGRQLDGLLAELRSFARGIYPAVLAECGLPDALASAARTMTVPASVDASGVGRYPEDIEVAVYFCCLEALQNVAKHAGADARARVRLWQDDEWLRFEVSDSGCGFDSAATYAGSGLVNMRDRIETVGGTLWVRTRPSQGTSVQGRVPVVVASAVADRPDR